MAVIVGLVLALQLPFVQTKIASAVIGSLQKNIDAEISVEKIHLKPFNTLVIKNIALKDKNPVYDTVYHRQADTLFSAGYIIAKFSFDGLFKHEGFRLQKAYVEDGTMNLVTESRSNDYATNLNRMFGMKKNPPKKPKSPKELFRIDKVEIKNFRFTLGNLDPSKVIDYGEGINWNDLDVRKINLSARKLKYKGGVMSGIADHLDFMEKTGYVCDHMEGKARVGNGLTHIDNLIIRDKWSNVKLNYYEMHYADIKAFNDYIEKVRMVGDIADSQLDFRTLRYFADALRDVPLNIRLSGQMDGTVADFHLKNLSFASKDGGFSGTVNGRMTGLPDISKTVIKAELSRSNITAEGLGKFLSSWTHGKIIDWSHLAKGIIFMPQAKVNGTLNRFAVKASINSLIGKVHADILLTNLLKIHGRMGIHGVVRTDDLNISRIIDAPQLKELSMVTGMNLSFGKGLPINCEVDSLKISRLNLLDYEYSGLAAAGTYNGDKLDARIICNDPALNFLFQGSFTTSRKTSNTVYRFYANIGNADLNAMNIDRRGRSRIRLSANANFTHRGIGDIIGNIELGNIVFENKSGTYNIGDISLASYSNEDSYRIKLNSSFAEASYSGSAFVTEFTKDLQNILLKKNLPALYEKPEYEWKGNSYNLSFNFHDSMDLLAYAMPGLYIADSTFFNVSIDRTGLLKGKLSTPRIAFNGNYLKRAEAVFNNADSSLRCGLTSEEIRAAGLSVFNNDFNVLAEDNHIGIGFTYDNKSELDNKGEFFLRAALERPDSRLKAKINILPSTLQLNSQEWNIMPSNIYFSDKELSINTLEVRNEEQSIRISGNASTEKKDTLTLKAERFRLGILNPLFKDKYGIQGVTSGTVKLTSPLKDMGVLVDLVCDSTRLADIPAGTILLHSDWDDEGKKFRIKAANDLDGRMPFGINADYTPKSKRLAATAIFDNFNVAYASPLLSSIFSEAEGGLSGKITVGGTIDKLIVGSEGTRLDKGRLKVAFTNVNYYPSGTFHLEQDGVHFDGIAITDDYHGKGELRGSINWRHFKDMSLNLNIKVNDIEAVNLSEKQGDAFYGHVFASGNVAILGPMDRIRMNIDAISTREGDFHIPLGSNSSTAKTNLLKFKEKEQIIAIDPYDLMMKNYKTQTQKEGQFDVKLKLNVTPSVEAFVEIDKASGNVLTGKGNGTLDIDTGKDKFLINGDYSLTSGNYKFVALGLVSRDFSIQDGSSIRFNGNIMDSNLNIDAIYKTKASLSTLISDKTSVANNRPVECGIKITDKLSNPRLKFSITVPDVDPIIKPRVDNALSTEDKIQKQFLSLIVSNDFLPDEQSGIVNNTSLFYSNISETLSNQLNTILQRLNIPLDLGLNYKPDEQGNNIFDVAVSTQLFNNRVVVNGNIGSKQYTSSSNNKNDVVGDIDIEIKLDRKGAFRLKLFSHSADQYTNYLDNSQKNGLGLTYQTEFNNIGTWIKNIFASKEKRRQYLLEEQEAMFNEGKNVINIEKNEEIKSRKALKKNGKR